MNDQATKYCNYENRQYVIYQEQAQLVNCFGLAHTVIATINLAQ